MHLLVYEKLERYEKAVACLLANWDALIGLRAHRLGCDCGASNDGEHCCRTLNQAVEALRDLTTGFDPLLHESLQKTEG